jgi:hypothetical protein
VMRPLLISGDRAGFPPGATCTLAIRSGRFTSTPVVPFAQIPGIPTLTCNGST